MKKEILILVIALLFWGFSEHQTKSELRPVLIQQLKNTYTDQNWFVPTKIALEGVTAEQSNWKDSTENHSIGELVSHMAFWNERSLKVFKGEEVSDFTSDNEVTFKEYTDLEWQRLVMKLDRIQAEWEQVTEKATPKQLTEWSNEIANMTAHNAYHAGQIIYIRKRNGWWKKK